MTTGMTTRSDRTDLQRLMSRSLLDVFNERDPERRADAIAEVYSPSIRFYEQDEVVSGTGALSQRVQQLLDGTPPDWVFVPAGNISVNHDLGRLSWALGPEGAAPVVTGTDIAIAAPGRIQALYVFLDAS